MTEQTPEKGSPPPPEPITNAFAVEGLEAEVDKVLSVPDPKKPLDSNEVTPVLQPSPEGQGLTFTKHPLDLVLQVFEQAKRAQRRSDQENNNDSL